MTIEINRAEIKTFCQVAKRATASRKRDFAKLPVAVRQDHRGITLSVGNSRATVSHTSGEPGPVESHTVNGAMLEAAAGRKADSATLSLSHDANGEPSASVLAWSDKGIPKSARCYYQHPGPDPALPEMATVRNLVPLLREAEQCADTESTRYALGGCLLDPAGHVVATDSRCIMALNSDPFPWAEPLVFPRLDCWNTAPFKRATDATVHHSGGTSEAGTIRGGLTTLSVGNWTFSAPAVDGRFPRWRDWVTDEFDSCAVMTDQDRHFLADAIPALREDWEEARALDLELNGHVKLLACQPGTDKRTDVVLTGSKRDDAEMCVTLDYLMLAKALRFGNRLGITSTGGPIVTTTDRGTYLFMPLASDNWGNYSESVKSDIPDSYPNATTVYSP